MTYFCTSENTVSNKIAQVRTCSYGFLYLPKGYVLQLHCSFFMGCEQRTCQDSNRLWSNSRNGYLSLFMEEE